MPGQLRLSRRALLSGTAAIVAVPWVRRGAHAVPAPPVSDDAWDKLARRVTGGVLRPGDPRFLALTRPENLRYYNPPASPDAAPDPDAPFAAVRPHDAKEVAAAIQWARDAGCRMVPRSGGHSYAGCSTIPGLVIHAGAMRQVKYHPGPELLEVGGGVLNGDIFDSLRHAGRAIVHGRCRSVGISAYLMGGGIGLAMRENGVGCDQVDSVELVLADGKKVRASASNDYKDLFWAACGGGGGNLGFATRWWLRTVPADGLVAFNASWWPNDPKAVLTRLVRALEAAPDELGAQMAISAKPSGSTRPSRISLIGQYHGPLAKFQTILGSALADAGQKAVLELSYWDAQEFFDIPAAPNSYEETSLFAGTLSDGVINDAINLSRSFPAGATDGRLTFFLTGGRINKIDAGATAFVHRSSQWLINPIIGWDDRDKMADCLKWQRDVQNTLGAAVGSRHSYQNFPDPELENHGEVYWGANLARLSKVKHAVDPASVFTPPRNQAIPQPA
jgi:FAD binding domain/Berberine and berberine like